MILILANNAHQLTHTSTMPMPPCSNSLIASYLAGNVKEANKMRPTIYSESSIIWTSITVILAILGLIKISISTKIK